MDIAIVQNAALMQYDVAMSGPDLLMDDGLYTAVLLSLLLDAPALPGDVLPSGKDADRRGCWWDVFLPPIAGRPDHYGSRLWLLRNAVQNQATLNAAQNHALEALDWMERDGVVGSVAVACSYPAVGKININVTLGQDGCLSVYDVLWSLS